MTKDFAKGVAIGAGALLGVFAMAWLLEKLTGRRPATGLLVGA